MDDQKPNLSLSLKESQRLALRENPEASSKLDSMIAGCLTLQKLYGRDLGDAGTVISLFHQILGGYPSGKVIAAFGTWLERGQEFPTPADIIGLIKRNGKPPIKESDVIAVRRKDGADRTPSDWRLLKEWESQQREEWEEPSEVKFEEISADNARLRQEISGLETQLEKQQNLIAELRANQKPAKEENKVFNTLRFMKGNGANRDELEEFAKTQNTSLAEFEVSEAGLR